MASLAIMRHLLTFFSRTENSVLYKRNHYNEGDAFSIIHDILPSSVLITTTIHSDNPIVVHIASSSDITIDTTTILQITPSYPTSRFPLLSNPIFKVLTDLDEDSDSFIIVYPFFAISTISCLLRTTLFYMTGDLQSVDMQRQLYLKPVTNRRFRHTTVPYELFSIPSLSVDNPNETKPLYYDINCTQQSLHLTVTFDYDKNNKEILVVSVISP